MQQAVRQEFLYPWRTRWTCSEDGYGPLGGSEIPTLPVPNVTINSNYTEGFVGYPHNFNGVVPNRILDIYTNWWGWSSTNAGSQVAPGTSGGPVFTMDDPTLISWVANKMTNIAVAEPLVCTLPLNICHWRRPFNLLPLDASFYSQDPLSIASNGLPQPDPLPWVKVYDQACSGDVLQFCNRGCQPGAAERFRSPGRRAGVRGRFSAANQYHVVPKQRPGRGLLLWRAQSPNECACELGIESGA